MKELLVFVIWIFCALGIFFSLAVICYFINPQNITRISMGVWAAAAMLDAAYLISWKEKK